MRLFLGRTTGGYYEIGRFKTYWRKGGFLKGAILSLKDYDFEAISTTRLELGEVKEILSMNFTLI